MNQGEPGPSDLTFRWQDRPPSVWRLLAAFLLCIGILALLPLLFRVAPPAVPRLPSLSQSILLLDGSSPANQLVLNRAHDRSSLILRPDQPEDLPLSQPLLPVFRPSFAGFEMRLKDAYAVRDKPVRPRLFQPSDLALPPLPRPEPAKPATTHPPIKWQLHLNVGGPMAQRRLVVPPDLSGLMPKDLARLRFRLAVQPSGRVFLVMPLDAASEDRDLVPALQSALSRARFEATDAPEVAWLPASFHWVAVVAKPQETDSASSQPDQPPNSAVQEGKSP